jgi:sulfotransferase family protein
VLVWTGVIGLPIVLFVAAFAYLRWYLRWESDQTSDMAYYARPVGDRRALKRQIRRLSRPVVPLVRLLAAGNQARATMPSFEYEGVSGPTKVSSPEIFERAKRYPPQPEDLFVVTQMRCGTTWMQQVVFETVMRGRGDLSDRGLGHLCAVSPWIDAVINVPLDRAPLVGEPRTRIIKSHLPTSLCPYSEKAKYIYVTRHPVSCFASIVDYNRSLIGPLTPPVETLAAWFCSDRMYWLPWPRHVDGWWRWAATRPNVLFVHYEEMTRDFRAVQERVEAFLGCTLSDSERALVAEKCSFKYMKEHEEVFEMAPPTMFSVIGGEYLKRGGAARHKDVTPAVRDRILEYCRTALANSEYPAGRFYPDLSQQR